MKEYFLIYFAAISVVSVISSIWDKHMAKKHGWRVRESTLLLLSALGGGVAMYLTMRIIRHKTLHNKFMIGIPVIIIIEIAALITICYSIS